MHEPFRVEPALPVQAVQTYAIVAPEATHFRPATCAEVDCPNHLGGWATIIDEADDLGQQQAYYIRNQSGRRYTEDRNQAPGLTVFLFEAGQDCFARHQLRLDRPEIFLVRDGDHRGNPTGNGRKHANADDWVDDFANNQQQLADEINKG